MQEIKADSGVLSILSGKLHTAVNRSPETLLRRWTLVAASLVVPVHKKKNREYQRVRQVTGKQGRRMRGLEEGEAHRNWLETATEVATRRAPALAAWWRGEEGGVGRNGEEGEGFL